MAIIAGNFELAELIKTHKETDIGEFTSSNVHLFFLLTHPPPQTQGGGGAVVLMAGLTRCLEVMKKVNALWGGVN